MLKEITIIFITTLLSVSAISSVYAEDFDKNYMIISYPDKISAISSSGNVYFTKMFDITVRNTGTKDINFQHICLIAKDDNGKLYNAGILQENLLNTVLKPGQNLDSFVSAFVCF